MQILERFNSTLTVESQARLNPPKQPRLIAIWENDQRVPNNCKLLYRWINQELPRCI
jgi:hypothetical protein